MNRRAFRLRRAPKRAPLRFNLRIVPGQFIDGDVLAQSCVRFCPLSTATGGPQTSKGNRGDRFGIYFQRIGNSLTTFGNLLRGVKNRLNVFGNRLKALAIISKALEIVQKALEIVPEAVEIISKGLRIASKVQKSSQQIVGFLEVRSNPPSFRKIDTLETLLMEWLYFTAISVCAFFHQAPSQRTYGNTPIVLLA